jgi:hypothetical protein
MLFAYLRGRIAREPGGLGLEASPRKNRSTTRGFASNRERIRLCRSHVRLSVKPPLPRRPAASLVDAIDTQELSDHDFITVSPARPALPLTLDGLSRLGAPDTATKTDELLAFDTASEDNAVADDEVTTTRLPALAPLADAASSSAIEPTTSGKTPFYRHVASEPALVALVLGPLPGGTGGSLLPVATLAERSRPRPSIARAYAPWIAGAVVAGSLAAMLIIQPPWLSRLTTPNVSAVATPALPANAAAAKAESNPTVPPIGPTVDDSQAIRLTQSDADDAGQDVTPPTPASPVKPPAARPAPRSNTTKRTATSAPIVLPDGTLDLSAGGSRATDR